MWCMGKGLTGVEPKVVQHMVRIILSEHAVKAVVDLSTRIPQIKTASCLLPLSQGQASLEIFLSCLSSLTGNNEGVLKVFS